MNDFKKPISSGGAITICVIFILFFLIFKCSCGESRSNRHEPLEKLPQVTIENDTFQKYSEPKTEENVSNINEQSITIAQKLATLDFNTDQTLDIEDYRVLEIQKHLYRLSETFKISEDRIGEITYKTSISFKRKKGLNYSSLELLRVADNNLDVYKNSGIKFEEYMALIFTLTEN